MEREITRDWRVTLPENHRLTDEISRDKSSLNDRLLLIQPLIRIYRCLFFHQYFYLDQSRKIFQYLFQLILFLFSFIQWIHFRFEIIIKWLSNFSISSKALFSYLVSFLRFLILCVFFSFDAIMQILLLIVTHFLHFSIVFCFTGNGGGDRAYK